MELYQGPLVGPGVSCCRVASSGAARQESQLNVKGNLLYVKIERLCMIAPCAVSCVGKARPGQPLTPCWPVTDSFQPRPTGFHCTAMSA